jgi:sugar (pentulose or hexulose) kinase
MTAGSNRNIAVIDIGKTNAKLVLLAGDGHHIDTRSTPNKSIEIEVEGRAILAHDTERLWGFILEGLAQFEAEHGVGAISITTHGATAALIAGDGLALPVLDYESPLPEDTGAAYDMARGDFSETLSPRLPNGLNLGAQIFWQAATFPEAFASVTAILTYPQYWAWRLTGKLASEVTSLGCHTDLWNPNTGQFSEMVSRQGWGSLFPPVQPAAAVLGHITARVAVETGLPADTQVCSGIHDSNASLVPYLGQHKNPVTIISSGTWTICMTLGGSTAGLDRERDSLANVDAFGRPVPTARFMGGREFDILVPSFADPSAEDVEFVIQEQVQAYPSFVPGVGPYGHGRGEWSVDKSTLTPGQRTGAATLYLAHLTRAALGLCGVGERIIVEGPLAKNALYCRALASLTEVPVHGSQDSTGTSFGAAVLCCGELPQAPLPAAFPPLVGQGFKNYSLAWEKKTKNL